VFDTDYIKSKITSSKKFHDQRRSQGSNDKNRIAKVEATKFVADRGKGHSVQHQISVYELQYNNKNGPRPEQKNCANEDTHNYRVLHVICHIGIYIKPKRNFLKSFLE